VVKAAGWGWPTAKAVLDLRHANGSLTAEAAAAAQRNFEDFQLASAQRLIRFYQVRHGTTTSHNGSVPARRPRRRA
jgi:hypothetical protein